MSKSEIRAMLAKLTPERRKKAVENIVRRLNQRSAIVQKHAHLFGEVSEPEATDKAGKPEK